MSNRFQIVVYNVHDEIPSVFDYRLQDGNPKVNNVRTNSNKHLLNQDVKSYNKNKNRGCDSVMNTGGLVADILRALKNLKGLGPYVERAISKSCDFWC